MGDIAKTLGKIGMGIGGAILGSILMPGAGTFLGATGGAALGGGLGGMAGNAVGSAVFDQEAPGLTDTILSGAGGAIGGGFYGAGNAARAAASAPSTFATAGRASTTPLSLGVGGPSSAEILSSVPSAGASTGMADTLAATPSINNAASGAMTQGMTQDDKFLAMLQSMKPSAPTTGQMAMQAGLTGGIPAAATMGAGLLTRRGEKEAPTYSGGARNYQDSIAERRKARMARRQQLGY